MISKPYSKEFFVNRKEVTLASARETIPVIIDLFHPQSVIDFGCGDGIWLSILLEYGVQDILGIDGDYVNRNNLLIPSNKFISRDLSKGVTFERRFDIALSLEVAEHLPQDCAANFIASITKTSDIAIFSAAIPSQGGLNHVNEQWPSYWAELFSVHDFIPFDCIRYRVWNNPRIMFYYRQNIICFIRRERLYTDSVLMAEYEKVNNFPLSVVHPDAFIWKMESIERLKKKAAIASRIIAKFKNIYSSVFGSRDAID